MDDPNKQILELPEWYYIIYNVLREFECFDEKVFAEGGGYQAYSQLYNVVARMVKLEKDKK